MVPQWKSRRHMHIPTPSLIDDPSARLHQPDDDPFDGPTRVLVPQIEPANQIEQVVREKAYLQHGVVTANRWQLVLSLRMVFLPSLIRFSTSSCP